MTKYISLFFFLFSYLTFAMDPPPATLIEKLHQRAADLSSERAQTQQKHSAEALNQPTKRMEKIAGLMEIIDQLAQDGAIFDGRVSHFTYPKNLANIAKTGAFMSIETLEILELPCQHGLSSGNELDKTYKSHVFFAPYLLDIDFVLSGDVFQVGVNLKNASLKPYQQCFNLHDGMAPGFSFLLKINEWFSIELKALPATEGTPDYDVTFFVGNLKKQVEAVSANGPSTRIYGDLTDINKFSLMLLFKLMETKSAIFEPQPNSDEWVQSEKTEVIDEFYQRISLASPAELRKILILFAQHLSICSEFQIGGSLLCGPGILCDFYDFQTRRLYSLANNYEECIQALSHSDHSSIPSTDVSSSMFEPDLVNSSKLKIWGKEIRCGRPNLSNVDFSIVNAENFSYSNYVNYVECGQTSPEMHFVRPRYR